MEFATASSTASTAAAIRAFERSRRLWLIAEYEERRDMSLADLINALRRPNDVIARIA